MALQMLQTGKRLGASLALIGFGAHGSWLTAHGGTSGIMAVEKAGRKGVTPGLLALRSDRTWNGIQLLLVLSNLEFIALTSDRMLLRINPIDYASDISKLDILVGQGCLVMGALN